MYFKMHTYLLERFGNTLSFPVFSYLFLYLYFIYHSISFFNSILRSTKLEQNLNLNVSNFVFYAFIYYFKAFYLLLYAFQVGKALQSVADEHEKEVSEKKTDELNSKNEEKIKKQSSALKGICTDLLEKVFIYFYFGFAYIVAFYIL